MSNLKKVFMLCFLTVIILTLVILTGCKTQTSATAATTAQETTTTAAQETTTTAASTETTVDTKIQYTYEKLREMAKAGKYVGEPAKGHTLAFANYLASFPFCKSVEDNIKKQWKLAGGADADLTILDNAYDVATAIKNADIIYSKKPEVFLEFQGDAKVNAMVGKKAAELGIYVIAIDVPVPGFPFMGINNYGTSLLVGQWAAEQVDKVFGGWDKVDRVFYLWSPSIGETVALRMWGEVDTFVEKFGGSADPRVEGTKGTLVDSGSTTETAQKAMTDILAKYPEAKTFITFCLNDEAGAGVQSAAEIAGRWDPDKWLLCTQGLDDLGIQLMRKGVIDGCGAYFPETYGEYLIPGALTYMYKNPVPPYMYIDNVLITPDNISQYYPQ